MSKSNFTNLMTTLRADEVNRFGKYLMVFYPNHVITKEIYPFYEKYAKRKKPLPDVEFAYKKLYKKEATTKALKTFNSTLSILFQALKDFLIHEKIKVSQFGKDYLWLKILQERELSHEKKLHFNKAFKNEKSNKKDELEQSLNLFRLHNFAVLDDDFLKLYSNAENFFVSLQHLETFRLGINLKYANILKNRENFLGIENSDAHFQPFLSIFENKPNLQNIENTLYYKLYVFSKQKQEDTYQDLKQFLLKHKDVCHPKSQQMALYIMINYIAQGIKSGQSKLNQDAFDLYEVALEKDVLIENGKMAHNQFQSIITVACFLKKHTWAENFIKDYQLYLEENIRVDYLKIANATILFSKKKFRKVFLLLKEFHLKESIYQMIAKMYFYASIYELGLDIDLVEKCDFFMKFLKRHKYLGESSVLAGINFAQLLKELDLKQISKEELQQEIKDAEHLYFKDWLKAKINLYQAI